MLSRALSSSHRAWPSPEWIQAVSCAGVMPNGTQVKNAWVGSLPM